MTDAQSATAKAAAVTAIVAAPSAPARDEARRARAAARAERAAAKSARKAETDAVVARRLAGEPAPPDDTAELSAQQAEREAVEVAAVRETPDDQIVQEPPSLQKARATPRERLALAIVVVGALGLLCSVVLAIGALLAAVEAGTGNPWVGAVSRTSDVLVGPLDGLVTFSGDNAQSKADLVTRGIASMVYLAIGLMVPSLLRRSED